MPSVKFYLNNPKRNGQLRVDEVSVRAVFTLDRHNRFELRPEEKIIPKYWDSRSQSVKTNHRHHIEVNNYLSDFKRDLLNLWREHRAMVTFEEFKRLAQDHFSQQVNPGQKKTVFVAYEKFLEQHEAGSNKKTYQKHKQVRDLLAEFDKQRPIDLSRMDLNFYDNFKAFLFSQPNTRYKKYQLVRDGEYYTIQPGEGIPVPLLDNTVYKLISNLKEFLNWATERGYIVHPSYKKWAIINHTQNPISLSIEELERLEKAILPQHLGIARDYLVFECRTGQRISDIKRFDISQFHDNTWSFNRKKGNRIHAKQVHVHFEGYCAPALKILEKHRYQLPKISEQKLNENIKEACRVAGINSETVEYHYSGAKCIRMAGPKHEWISTHSGRKTFITLALQFMQPKIVKDLAGISAVGTKYKLNHEPFVIFDIMTGKERLPYLYFADRVKSFGFEIPTLLHYGYPISINGVMERLGEFGHHGAIEPAEGAVWRVQRKGKVDFLAKYVRSEKMENTLQQRKHRSCKRCIEGTRIPF